MGTEDVKVTAMNMYKSSSLLLVNIVVTVHGNLAACSFANTSGPVNLADRRENVSCVHFQHTQQSDAFSVPLSNGSVTHANCNEYQSRRNEEKSKNI